MLVNTAVPRRSSPFRSVLNIQSKAAPHRSLVEYGAAGAALLGAVLLCLVVGRGGLLFEQPAWLDEYHTLFVAGKGTVVESLGALSRGADFNPPLLHLAIRIGGAVSGGVDVTGRHLLNLRLLTFSWMLLAFLGIYILLRRQFAPVTSFLGVLALWTHPLIVRHAFELRSYGLWLATLTWFIVALGMDPRRHRTLRAAAIAVTAVLLCLVHYFAVFTWALALGGFLWRRSRNTGRLDWLDLAAAASGPCALLTCAPLYFGQRSVLSVPTWVQPLSTGGVLIFLSILVAALPLIAILLKFAPRVPGANLSLHETRACRRAVWRDPALTALLSVGMLPVAMLGFSLLVQPAMITRYSIASVVLWPLLIALAARDMHERLLPVVVTLIVVAGACTSRLVARSVETREAATQAIAMDLRERVSVNDLVLVADRKDLYPIALARLAPAGAILAYPELPDSMSVGTAAIDIVERDVARVHSALYGFPTLRSFSQIRGAKEFWMVTPQDSSTEPGRWFPTYQSTRVARRLYLLKRRTTPTNTGPT